MNALKIMGLVLNDLFGLGELNYEIQDYDKAIKFYSQALECEPDDVDILTSLGLAYICKSEYRKAIQLYKKALEIEIDDPLIWDNLGIAYEYNQEYEKAKEGTDNELGDINKFKPRGITRIIWA